MMSFSLPVLHDHAEEQSVCFAADVSFGAPVHLPVPFCLTLLSLVLLQHTNHYRRLVLYHIDFKSCNVVLGQSLILLFFFLLPLPGDENLPTFAVFTLASSERGTPSRLPYIHPPRCAANLFQCVLCGPTLLLASANGGAVSGRWGSVR
ncbi:hypothetical protein SISSUDRAFT_746433 [Sistotremastrum suecicum HHB10207 ss-3]|uniref:Uncharacterized protein n=1 Tax=Sistotremastrum suecicum HHB10207 ss-3 TaxID=1314776 RepID=A0A166HY19_9AGAM|nr:hypothetical protein SISSUDRAFT_746433 [Sistotremastrum suecicum HHB10207 ss-3]